MTVAVRLLEVEPDLARFLSAEDRADAERLTVPVIELDRGDIRPAEIFAHAGAFGALVLDGMVLQRLQLGAHMTMKVHGSGDFLARVPGPVSTLVSAWSMRVVESTRLAMFSGEVLAAFRRWPALAAGFHVRMGEQAERVAVQLAICQLPRVEERLLALLWWLAESWGRVSSVGTVLPLSMTHDALGALVGARRPTVTLALGELVDRGAIARQDRGWLLLEAPPAVAPAPSLDDPVVIPAGHGEWDNRDEPPAADTAALRAELIHRVEQLRDQHTNNTQRVRTRLSAIRAERETFFARRAAVSRRRAPS